MITKPIPLQIPKEWTFKDRDVAANFDKHVREQLPWYDLATQAVVHIARHYVPNEGGLVYDIGASTGNVSMALLPSLFHRFAKIRAIEESPEMCEILNTRAYDWCSQNKCLECYEKTEPANALDFEFQQYDLAICFLTFMFFPVWKRRVWLQKLTSLAKPGGAFLLVDKIATPSGYAGSVMRRLTMDWKIRQGATAEDIIKKELSLAGYQRPLNETMLEGRWVKFFQMGEFAGWLWERPE